MGKLRLRKGRDLVLVIAASPVKATPSSWAWGLLWKLAAPQGRQVVLPLGRWGHWALLGSPPDPGRAKCLPPGPRQQGVCQGWRPVINQFGEQEAQAASFLACSPSPACLPCPWGQLVEKRAQQTSHDQGKLRKSWIEHPHQSSSQHPGLPRGSGEPGPPPNPWGCSSSSPKIL